MICDVHVDECSPVVPKDHEHEEQAEREGRHEEEVDGDEISRMSGKKGPLRRGGPRQRPVHVLATVSSVTL